MADKAITDLMQAQQITGEDLFVLEQSGEAKKLKGSQVVQYAKDAVAAEVQGVKEYADNAKASADAAAASAAKAASAAQGIDAKVAAADASAKAAASSAAAAASSATGVDEKVQAAQTAATNAAKSEAAAKNAQTAAANAQKAAETAQTGAQSAKTAAESAQEAAESAKDAAAGSATAAGQKASQAAQSAEDAASAKSAAEMAKTDAQAARDAIANMMVEAITLETGKPATVSKSLVDNVYKLVFGLPKGETGAPGPRGATGNGISGIALKSGTHAPGTSDVYTITLTDGTTFDFAVYNGANGAGAGDMLASVYDPQGKRTDVFKYVDDAVGGVSAPVISVNNKTGEVELDYSDVAAAPNSQGTELIKGTQTEKTNLWTGVSTAATLYDGKIIDYYLPHDGNGATVTLTLTLSDGTVTGAIPVKMRGARAITTHFTEKSIIHMVYVEANNCWQCQAPYWEIYYSGVVRSSAATLAKTANFTNFALKDNSWVQINMAYGNSAAKEMTLNINNTGAKPIYINGLPSSDSNYKLPAGTYFVFYDGTAYQFRTDGYLYGTVPTNRKVNGHTLDNDVTVSKGDVGLGNVDNVKQYSKSNPPPYPVTSVNGQTGDVQLTIPTPPSASDTTPKAPGTASAGNLRTYSRGDHVHPAEVFWATKDVTTYDQIIAAVQANKLVLAQTNTDVYQATSVDSGSGIIRLTSLGNLSPLRDVDNLYKGVLMKGYMVLISTTKWVEANVWIATAEMAKPQTRKVTLTVAGWNSSTKQQTVACTGILADATKQEIFPNPVDTSYDSAWDTCGIKCVAQGANSLTFQCSEIPTSNIEIYVTVITLSYKG